MYRRFLSVRYFRTRLVNWLSVVGVMVGVGVMIVVWSVFTGFATETRRAIRGTLSDVELRPPAVAPSWDALAPALAASPDVVGASPRLSSYVIHPFFRAGSEQQDFHAMRAVGVDWALETARVEAARTRGASDASGLPQLLVAADDPGRPFYSRRAVEIWGPHEAEVALKGCFSAEFLKAFIDPGVRSPAEWLGKKVELVAFRRLVTETGDTEIDPAGPLSVFVASVYASKQHDEDVARVYFDREALWRLTAPVPKAPPGGRSPAPTGPVGYSEVAITVSDFEGADAAKGRIVEGLGARGLAGFEAFSWHDQRASILAAVQNEKVLLAIVISFIGLLAGFTILATLTLTVVEKTRDVGVLRALGASPGGVMGVFLGSGVLIGTLGGVLGLGLGVVLTLSVNSVREWLQRAFDVDLFPKGAYGFDRIPYVFDTTAMAWIAGGCMGVAFLASLLPSLRAARLDPVVALRHE